MKPCAATTGKILPRGCAGCLRRQISRRAGAPGWKPGSGAASPQFAATPLHRGHRAAIPRREALILQAALNHPWLLHDRLEEFAEAEFRHADTRRLKAALIDAIDHRFADEAGEEGGRRFG